MQALEDRTEKSRREMDLHDTIDTVRVLNSRNQHVDIDKVCPEYAFPNGMHSPTVLLIPRLETHFLSLASYCHRLILRRLSQHVARKSRWQSWSAAGAQRTPQPPPPLHPTPLPPAHAVRSVLAAHSSTVHHLTTT